MTAVSPFSSSTTSRRSPSARATSPPSRTSAAPSTPSPAPAHDHLAIALIRAGRREEAARAVDRLAELKGEDAEPGLFHPEALRHARDERFADFDKLTALAANWAASIAQRHG